MRGLIKLLPSPFDLELMTPMEFMESKRVEGAQVVFLDFFNDEAMWLSDALEHLSINRTVLYWHCRVAQCEPYRVALMTMRS